MCELLLRSISCIVLSFAFFVFPPGVWAASFVFLGQSNMTGAGIPEEVPEGYKVKPTNLRYFIQEKEIVQFSELDKIGPDWFFLVDYCNTHPDEQVIGIKCAWPSSLYGDWFPEWSPSRPTRFMNVSLFKAAMNIIKGVRNTLGSTEPVHIIWVQGERDSAWDFSAREYGANLVHFVMSMRAALESPNGIFICGQTGTGYAHLEWIRQGQVLAVTMLMKAGIADSKGLPVMDKLHLTTGGAQELGRRLYEKFLEVSLAHPN